MRLEAPESGTLFVHVPLSEPLYAVVVGHPASYRTHWVKGKRGKGVVPVRCLAGDGESCAACNSGLKYNVRYMIPVRRGLPSQEYLTLGKRCAGPCVVELEREVRMFEVGRPQYGFVATREMINDWIGTEILSDREKPQRNALIRVVKIGRVTVPDEDQLDARTAAAQEGLQQYWAWVRDTQRETVGREPAPLGLDG